MLLTKFKGDTFKENKDTAPQSREILQTFVWWGVWTFPLPYRRIVNFLEFSGNIFLNFQTKIRKIHWF